MNNTLGGFTDLDFIRIPGVLQRFSVSYLAIGTLGLLFTPSRLTAPEGSVILLFAIFWLTNNLFIQREKKLSNDEGKLIPA